MCTTWTRRATCRRSSGFSQWWRRTWLFSIKWVPNSRPYTCSVHLHDCRFVYSIFSWFAFQIHNSLKGLHRSLSSEEVETQCDSESCKEEEMKRKHLSSSEIPKSWYGVSLHPMQNANIAIYRHSVWPNFILVNELWCCFAVIVFLSSFCEFVIR